jgi:hypothetical protein
MLRKVPRRCVANRKHRLSRLRCGVLVQASDTVYTQDLVAPRSQMLVETRGGEETRYLYGLRRLAALDAAAARTWPLHASLADGRGAAPRPGR